MISTFLNNTPTAAELPMFSHSPFFYDLHKELGHELIMFQAIRSERASSMMEISLGANNEGRKEGG